MVFDRVRLVQKYAALAQEKREEGAVAFGSGLTLDDCPYPPTSFNGYHWSKGLFQAERQIKGVCHDRSARR